MNRPFASALPLLVVAALGGWTTAASAEPLGAHVTAGGAHAVTGTQSSEFGAGGAGAGTVELPVAARFGVQAGAGTLVLSQGAAPSDARIAPTSTGAAFLGTVGVRVRAFGADRVAGPWIDSNVGIAQTGDLTRPTFEAHIGWDVRVSRASRIDVGPFVGYTQIFQPDTELRSGDARVLTAGLSFSLGRAERARALAPVGPETTLPLAAPPAPEPVGVGAEEPPAPVAEVPVLPLCPDGEPAGEDGCGNGVRIFEDRILLQDVIHFEFDSAKIREQSQPLVRRIAAFINAHRDIVDISIEGHADEVGTDEYNQELSERRANSMRAMLGWFGVQKDRLRVVAHGKSLPVVVTMRPERRNRRVEMYVTRTHDAGVASAHGKSEQ